MPLEEFIISVFCLIDDLYNQLISTPLRRRGPPQKLADSEVITMEIVGEWQGHHFDKAIWKYFSQHWKPLFPNIPDRSQFVRQAANLWVVKQRLQAQFVSLFNADRSENHLIDGFPIEVCARTRVPQSKLFRGEAGFGCCASRKKRFYGFQGHLLSDAQGIPVAIEVSAANIDERDVAYDLINDISGLLIGDKGYIRPALKADCKILDIDIQTPLRRNMKDKRSPAVVRLLSG